MKGYKGFKPGMICRGKQYQEHTEFTEPRLKSEESGMHFCSNPFGVWMFYPPADETGNLNEFAEVEAMDDPQTDDNSIYRSYRLRIGAKLDLYKFIKAGADFIFGHVKSTNSNTGYQSVATNTDDQSAATNDGYRSVSVNTGNCGTASTDGSESFAITTGYKGKVKGAIGCWIACAEWAYDGIGSWFPVDFKAIRVDGEKIKADTWYRLEEGKFIEVEEG